LASAVIPLARSEVAPRIAIAAALPDSGADNPVTAVLLNFRAYDTLMEVGVLLAAVFAVHAISVPITPTRPQRVGPVLATFARLMVPLAVLVATYFLWVGAKQPGGAFQAAAILAAAWILRIVSGGSAPHWVQRRWRLLLVGGLGAFLLVGLAGLAVGGNFLELSPQWAGGVILIVETVLTVSMALILLVLCGSTSQGQDEFDPVAAEKRYRPAVVSQVHAGHEFQEPSP
jgi:multisubunit Na+/H+ antiporter MnhB subunit